MQTDRLVIPEAIKGPLEDCEVPFLLREGVYVDLRYDKKSGIARLVDFFKRETTEVRRHGAGPYDPIKGATSEMELNDSVAGGFMNVRCVVTGQTESGKSVFVRDAPVEPITVSALPGFEFHRLWGSDSVPKLPSDGTAPPHPRYFPPKSGFRFGLFTVPPEAPEAAEPADVGPAFAELQQKLPGIAEVLELGNPGMHTTDTVDFDVILSGEVYLELDDGAEVLLKAGDCVVQNGTRHARRNRSSHNCVIAVTLVGAERSGS